MAREQDYDWVNAWMSASSATTGAVVTEPAAQAIMPPETAAGIAAAPERSLQPRIAHFVAGRSAAKPDVRETAPRIAVTVPHVSAPLPDQLQRDIAEIERARDALAADGGGPRVRTFMLVPSRSVTDAAPLLVGGVLALVMLTVFGAAAAVTKFGR